jgi:mannose-1-phosphate guanylyltransferase
MSVSGTTWVIVLAGGDGRRLHRLTTNASGMAVPKQFCSLRGGYSLLRDALFRAEAVAVPEHICTIVAEQHRLWWGPALGSVSKSNIIVQPRNCGTANGILLPLLHIMQRDPEARIVLLPSDHHVDNEGALATALRRAIRQLHAMSRQILLLGISPEQADPGLGYIVPGDKVERNMSTVIRFVEKPCATRAQRLIKGGALWNSFIVAARASALLELFQTRIPQIVDDMRVAVVRDQSNPNDSVATTNLYRRLSDIDFSKQVLEGAESMLRVVPVPRCGWSDLGTPTRLAETLQRLPQQGELPQDPSNPFAGFLNLSQQHARLQALGDSFAAK